MASSAQAAVVELILVTDGTGTLTAASDSARLFLGMEPAELEGLTPADITAPDLAPLTAEAWSTFLAEGSMSGPYRLQHRDGRIIDTVFRARAHDPLPGYHAVRHQLVPRAQP